MTAAALLARIGRAGQELASVPLRTWVVGQWVRNALQTLPTAARRSTRTTRAAGKDW